MSLNDLLPQCERPMVQAFLQLGLRERLFAASAIHTQDIWPPNTYCGTRLRLHALTAEEMAITALDHIDERTLIIKATAAFYLAGFFGDRSGLLDMCQ